MANAFNEFLRGQQASMQQGQNALAIRQFAEQQQRDKLMRDIMARSAMPAMPAAPAMGPMQAGVPRETLADYPEQGGGPGMAIQQLLAKGFIPEAMAIQSMMPKSAKPEGGFTLSPGERRYSPTGQLIAEVPTEVQQMTPETDPLAPWSKISDPKKRDEARIRFGAASESKLDKLREGASAAERMNQDIDRFLQLNESNATGPTMGIWGAKSIRGAFDPDIQEMQGISDRLTPLMRQGLPGAASDRDVAMFRGGTVSVEKGYTANRNIGLGLKAANQNKIDRLRFMDTYLAERGHLRGAEEEWKKYLEANPIFNSKSKDYSLNQNRMDYDTWANSGKPINKSDGKSIIQAPQAAIDYLKANNNPIVRQQFKQKYGYLP